MYLYTRFRCLHWEPAMSPVMRTSARPNCWPALYLSQKIETDQEKFFWGRRPKNRVVHLCFTHRCRGTFLTAKGHFQHLPPPFFPATVNTSAAAAAASAALHCEKWHPLAPQTRPLRRGWAPRPPRRLSEWYFQATREPNQRPLFNKANKANASGWDDKWRSLYSASLSRGRSCFFSSLLFACLFVFKCQPLDYIFPGAVRDEKLSKSEGGRNNPNRFVVYVWKWINK